MTSCESGSDLAGRCRTALGAGPPPLEVWVPGRIEVLGKHTDYAGGRSLVCATQRGFAFAARPRPDRQVVIHDALRGESRAFVPGAAEGPAAGWEVYPRAAAGRLRRNFGPVAGADIAFASDLPPAAGLSSSSALLTGCYVVLSRLSRLESTDRFRREVGTPEREAEYASCIENGRDFGALEGDAGVGTLGGSQDHAAILLSEPGRLLQCAFRPLRRERTVAMPPGWIFAVGTSGVAAEKSGAARESFNRIARVAGRVMAGVERIAGTTSLLEALARDPALEERIRGDLAAAAGGEFSPADLLGRFEQMMLESTVLVPDAASALERGDLAALGDGVALSQLLAERLLGNQVPETVALVREARAAGAPAASAFGAGLGGSAWALVPEAGAEDFLAEWKGGYLEACPARRGQAEFFLTGAGRPLTMLAAPPPPAGPPVP